MWFLFIFNSNDWLSFFNQYSNVIILISHLWITGWLFFFWKKKYQLPKINTVLLICLFTFLSAFTYLSKVISFFYPLFILIDFVTSIVAMFVSLCFPSIVIYALKMPSLSLLIKANSIAQEELTRRQLLEIEHNILISNLTNKVDLLELELKRYKWVDKKYENIEKIKQLLAGAK